MIMPTVFYTLSTILITAITVSYLIAYILSSSISILSLLLFFTVLSVIFGVITVDLWMNQYGITRDHIPFVGTRSVLLFISSLFLFYTTWSKN